MAPFVDGSIWPLLLHRARQQPSLPFLTSIDRDSMRTELSGTSLLNAIAKTSGALVTEGGLEPGARIAMHLPWHWQRVVWSLAAWNVGAELVVAGEPAQCELLVADAQSARAFTDECEPWVVSLHPLGLAERGLPSTVVDATSLCRMQPDALLVDPVAGDGAALVLQDGRELSRLELLGWAREQDGTDSRILIDRSSQELAGWAIPALHPLLTAGAVVMCDGQDLAQTAQQETATRIWQ